jgi:hypothetical protein
MIKAVSLAIFLTIPLAESTVVHKRTQGLIDIEGTKKDIWISCSPVIDASFLEVRVLDSDKVYLFFYRRVQEREQCLKEKNEYEKMMNYGGTVRVVGIRPDEEVNEPKYRKMKGIPERFTRVNKLTSAYFVRLQVKDKCKSYFSEDCDLPKNYWGGVIPEE